MNIELKPIAESKVRQLGGDVCGVLVRTDGKLAAVDEHGRVQWLQDGQGAEPVAWEATALGGKRLFHNKAEAEMSAEIYGGGARPLVYGDTHPQPTLQSNQEDVIALLTNALANIRDTDASAKTLQAMAALALRAAKETCDD